MCFLCVHVYLCVYLHCSFLDVWAPRLPILFPFTDSVSREALGRCFWCDCGGVSLTDHCMSAFSVSSHWMLCRHPILHAHKPSRGLSSLCHEDRVRTLLSGLTCSSITHVAALCGRPLALDERNAWPPFLLPSCLRRRLGSKGKEALSPAQPPTHGLCPGYSSRFSYEVESTAHPDTAPPTPL